MADADPLVGIPQAAATGGIRFHGRGASLLARTLLLAGLAALCGFTLVGIARVSWSTEQGAHGPIVLAIAIWLFWRRRKAFAAKAEPGSPWLAAPLMALFLFIHAVAVIAGSIVIASAALYAFLVSTLYLLVGWRAILAEWFVVAYFLFLLPPPGSVVALATQPLRLQISEYAVRLLGELGYPVAREGLQIYVAQYVLAVKTACGGLNSMISLTAIGLFYGYFRRTLGLSYGLVLLVAAMVCAVLANFVRVLALILVTYHLGNAAAQGFLHGLSGLMIFAVALMAVMAFDSTVQPLRQKLNTRSTRSPA